MKSFSPRKTFLIISTFLFSIIGNSQTKYVFTGAALDSGTALSVGAVYKFLNVKSGVDARVKILNYTGGISITNIDGGGGFTEALQPILSVPAYANGYAELRITFYEAGTNTLLAQTELPVTPIDVDGQLYSRLPLYEFDQIEELNGFTFFQWAGSELTMIRNGVWAEGKNKAAVDYPGIDTSQKQVMFTTVNANVSSMRVRVGADNRSASNTSRLRSIYFSKFDYPYTLVLSKGSIVDFNVFPNNNKVEIKGTLSSSHSYNKMIIERSTSSSSFENIGELSITGDESAVFPFTFVDAKPVNGINYYRIRQMNTQSNNQEISKTKFVNIDFNINELAVINSIFNSGNPVITIQSRVEEEAEFMLSDLAGRIILKNKLRLYSGTNNIRLPSIAITSDYFVLSIKAKYNLVNKKLLVQKN